MFEFFFKNYANATTHQVLLEIATFVFGIFSVWYAKQENILVYPTGIIATIITSYLLFVAGYFGDMIVNLYFTIMSVYGWVTWSKTTVDANFLQISLTNLKDKKIGFMLFFITIIFILLVYKIIGNKIEIENYFDILTSGLFFVAMWLMARKKLENWALWIIANTIAIPLYAYRGLRILALQYIIFTILAILAHYEWNKTYNKTLPRS
ncbi:MAG: hypothetical protein RLZZ312_1786 [Bacteroidota bacterium]|jgi:nicotinamide mononucleotide transporter